MELIVTSDSHGQGHLLDEIEKWYPHAYLYLNCGDLEDSPQRYSDWLFVRGNNDYFATEMPEERIIKAGEHKILMVHSHRFSYYKREEQIAQYALAKGCDVALFGHTHNAYIGIIKGVVLVNPGSLWMSRNGKSPSFAIVHIDGPNVSAEIKYEEDWPLEKQEKKQPARRRFRFR